MNAAEKRKTGRVRLILGILACLGVAEPGMMGAATADESRMEPEETDFEERIEAAVVPGQYLVGFQAGGLAVGARRWGASDDLGGVPGVQILRRLREPSGRLQAAGRAGVSSGEVVLVELKGEVRGSVTEVLDQVRSVPGVVYVEPNTVLKLMDPGGAGEAQRFPNDFEFGRLWNLRNTGSGEAEAGADIDAASAWALAIGSRSVRVAVIDTGIDYFHPDLEANLWMNPGEVEGNGVDDDGNGYVDDVRGYDFVSDDSDPMDDQMHGTHVAGTIGAVGNNVIGVTGVCWETSLMALKAFNENGEATLFQVIEAIRYAAANGARVINASWGQRDRSRALADAIVAAHQAGVIIVAAAGNDQSEIPSYPAAYPEAVTVAATNPRDQRSIFSNYGRHVDVAAPGESILSTVPNHRYELASGTSMAAPHVTGIAALLLGREPRLSTEQVEDVLRNAVDPVKGQDYVGLGRVDAGKALRLITPLPRARLAVPSVWSGRVTLTGTAVGSRFASYDLAVGEGVYPTNWVVIHAGAAPVESGALLEDYDTAQLAEGGHVLRLTVNDTLGQTSTDRAEFTVRNVHLASPAANDIVRAGAKLALRGTVHGVGRTFRVEHGVGLRPTVWSTAGVTLVAGGEGGIRDGVLGEWDTGAVAADEFHTLRLTAWIGDEQVGESVVPLVGLDSRLRLGWPQRIEVNSEYDTNDWRQVVVGDLDRDGQREVIVVSAGTSEGVPAQLRVFAADGSLRWSRSVPTTGPESDVPVLGDMDGDGRDEILVDVGEAGEIRAYRGDGVELGAPWPLMHGLAHAGKVLADMDGDGQLELLVYGVRRLPGSDSQRELAILKRDGVVVGRWAMRGGAMDLDVPRLTVAVGDFDDDPDLECVMVWGDSEVALVDIRHLGGPRWTAQTAGVIYASPVVGDVDGDFWPEVVIGVYDPVSRGRPGTRGGVYLFNRHGELRPGWPVLIESSFAATPALGDLDGDATQEVVVVDWETKLLHALRADGFELLGWPLGPVRGGVVKTPGVGLGDLDGDGQSDVVVSSPGFLFQAALSGDLSMIGGIKAWRVSGTQLDLHPRREMMVLPMESSGGNRSKAGAPVLTDLDGNGRLDVVATSVEESAYSVGSTRGVRKGRFSVYAWELPAPFNEETATWPMWRRDVGQRGYQPVVRPPNQAPQVLAIPDQVVAQGGSFFPLALDRHVTDPDHPRETLAWRVEGAGVLLVRLDTNRVVTVTPPSPDWLGEETLTFVVVDPGGLEARGTARFAVRLDYFPPRPVTDRVEVLEDASIAFSPVANDGHPLGRALILDGVGRPEFGTAEASESDRVEYVPNPDFAGQDRFTYIVADDTGARAIGQVEVTVVAQPDPPVAEPDRLITDEDVAVTFDVLANDRDVDGDVLSVVDYTLPSHGKVRAEAGGVLVYEPSPNWSGADAFLYYVSDGQGQLVPGEVSLQVKPVDDPPVAVDVSFVLNRNSSQEVFFRASDPDSPDLTFKVLEGPEHGELWAYPTLATYYPKKGYVGTDRFTYEASDGTSRSAPATVSFQVLELNNPPVSSSVSLTNKVGRRLTVRLPATDADEDGLTFRVTRPPQHGMIEGEGAERVYVPEAGYLGEDAFAFVAGDGQAESGEAIVRITQTDHNTAPVGDELTVQLVAGASASVVLTGRDGENDPLTFLVVTNPASGVLRGVAPELTYTPIVGFVGPDRMAFVVDDGEATSPPVLVSLKVVQPNEAPQTRDQWIQLSPGEPTPVFLDVVDPDGDWLRGAILRGPTSGRLYGRGTNYVYQPDAGFLGADTFTYRVWDGTTYGATTTVRISVDPPLPPGPPRFDALKVLTGGSVQIRIVTTPGKPLTIEVSEDLVQWKPWMQLTPATAELTVTDTDTAGSATRYYRAWRP